VLIVFESRPESIIALSQRIRDAHGVGSASSVTSEKGEDMSSVKSTEKWRAVETALTQIERQFGKGSIMRLGDQPEQVMSVIPTGSLAVDAALGVGGIPRGRVVEGIGSKSRTTLLFINQIREKIGVMFGNPETTTGGRALKFYASIRIDIRRIASLKDGDVVVGSRTKVKVVKNKVASPFRQAEFDITYGEGISRSGELIDLGLESKIVEKSGSWLSYGDLRIGQGRENAKQFLKENPELSAEIETKLRKALGLSPVESATEKSVP